MRHLQPDLNGGHLGERAGFAPLVDRGKVLGADVGKHLSVGGREIENRKIAMLMPHRRAEPQLHVDQQWSSRSVTKAICGDAALRA